MLGAVTLFQLRSWEGLENYLALVQLASIRRWAPQDRPKPHRGEKIEAKS
jgi:hypothetical protein